MILGAIALKIRAAETDFENRVAGAAELDKAMNNTLTNDVAFVIPLVEDAIANERDTSTEQTLTERFGVVVALKMDTTQKDKTGLTAYDRLHDIREQLFKPLIGWDLGFKGLIYYRGGRLLDIKRSYLWWQFEFEYTSHITVNPDGYGEIQTTTVDDRQQVSQLPDFDDIFAQYILHPSVKWRTLKENDKNIELPDDIANPDMEQLIDFTDDPLDGGYNTGYASGFDFYKKGD